MQRRSLLIGATALLGATTLAARAATPATTLPVLQVWKDPNCGCCKDWISYLQRDGFQVQAFDTCNTAVRQRLGLPVKYGSCHTALVGGYVVEGHVNAREIRRLLTEKPKAIGIAVPGMPVGSPGMDGPEYGGRKDPYDVLLVQADGSSRVYQSYQVAQAGGAPAAAPSSDWTEAEVRRIDAAAGKISLKHGEIRNLDMPPMTMVFQVRDPAALAALKVGDRIRFTADKVQGAYTVLQIEKLP